MGNVPLVSPTKGQCRQKTCSASAGCCKVLCGSIGSWHSSGKAGAAFVLSRAGKPRRGLGEKRARRELNREGEGRMDRSW